MRKTLPWTLARSPASLAFRLIEPAKRFLNASPRGSSIRARLSSNAFSKHLHLLGLRPGIGALITSPDSTGSKRNCGGMAGGFRLMAFLAT